MYNYGALILSTDYEAKIQTTRITPLKHGMRHHPDAEEPKKIIAYFMLRPGTSRSRAQVASLLGFLEKDHTLTGHLRELLNQGILEML